MPDSDHPNAFLKVFSGIAFKAPFWAMIMLIMFGCIVYGMIWFMSSIDASSNGIEHKINHLKEKITKRKMEIYLDRNE